ncbi:MAG: SEC-C metal-binding domain-containing protein [Terriglobia bacterium]
MEDLPSITPEDVGRYRRLRALGQKLSGALSHTIPKVALSEIGKALGIERDGVLCFDTMDVPAVLFDACLFDWLENGRNLVEKYIEAHPTASGTDEHALLEAYGHARFRIILPENVVVGAGAYCLDTLSDERFFLMDIGLSQSLPSVGAGLFATRTVPLGRYWMTTGAALPIFETKTGGVILRKIEHEKLLRDKTTAGEHKLALGVIRVCLDSGAADHIRYGESAEDENAELGTPAFTPPASVRRNVAGRNDPCPCGSGKKYKRCCWGK